MANRHHNTPSSSVLDAEKQPTTPSREQTRPVPATLPMANRPHNAPSSSVASPAPQARGTPASHANLDHEFTKTVMELIKNQPLAAAIRQKVRETVNRFAFTTNGQRATITDLREKLKAKDGLLQQSDGERNELEHGNRKLRRQIEEKDQELEVSRKHTQKLRENMEKDKDLLLKRAKEITELKARLAELEGGIISRAPTEDLEEEWVGFEEPEGYMAEVEEPVAKEPVEEEPVEEEELLGEEGPPGEQPVDSEMEDTIQVGVEPDVEDPIQAEGQMEVEATSREGIQSDGESMSMESEDSQDSDIDPTPTLGQGPQPLRSSKRTPVKGNARNPYKKTMTYQGFDEDEDEDEEWDAWEEPDDENDDDYVP
ncbi:hypothetical protein B0T16DRAFT_452963 [Cercophora newfieldiana]|uniref:Uncharacterized protein n=1 Tax=Cercophora newfieldiana TaxID=92897 RepID=A0AA40CZM7_9PEZI|nr:hypothetical protein B0T16DRAFT_452963 [Cercophora newfieldiana]